MRKRTALLLVIASLLVAGCNNTNSNTNGNANANANANARTNANANANTNANRNANENANRPSANANITRQEYEKNKESWGEEAKRLGRTMGTGVNGGWIRTKG